MASELYQSFGAQAVPTQQNPREQALSLLKQRGIQIPDGISGNPQAIIQHLMQSGRIPQGRLNMAQQMLSKLFRR
jgi:hypothetical protein